MSSDSLTCDDFFEGKFCDEYGLPSDTFLEKYGHLQFQEPEEEDWGLYWTEFLRFKLPTDRVLEWEEQWTPDWWCCVCAGGICLPGYEYESWDEEWNEINKCLPCGAGKYNDEIDGTCVACTPGRYADGAGRSECLACPPGKNMPGNASRECVRCPKGRQSDPGSTSCEACSPGKYADEDGTPECMGCPAGKYQSRLSQIGCDHCKVGAYSEPNASFCELCPPGKYSIIASDACESCHRGTFVGEPGSSTCTECFIGRFADVEGMENCTVCGTGRTSKLRWTTMQKIEGRSEWIYSLGATSEDNCGCDKGWRLDDGECIQCGEGTICEGMGEVSILQGYYSALPVSVYHCFKDTATCPGGPPGQSCAEGRRGISCDQCEDFMKPSDDGTCVACEGADKAPVILAGISCFFALCIIYYALATRQKVAQSHNVILAMISCSQLITLVQQLSVLGILAIDYDDPMKTFLAFMQLFILDIRLLSVGCIGTLTNVGHFTLTGFMAILVLATLVLIHIIHVLVVYRGRFSEHVPVLISAISTAGLLSFITVVSLSVRPLQCSKHPNGKWTVRTYKDVICWQGDEDHSLMVFLGLVFLILPTTFLTYITYIAWKLPQRVYAGDVTFLDKYGFLFFRFRPGCGWFINWILARSFVIAVAPVLPNPFAQVLGFNVCQQANLLAVMHYKPWRARFANVLDIASSLALLMVLNLATVLLYGETDELQVYWWICIFVILLILVVGILVVVNAIVRLVVSRLECKRKSYSFFLCHHKARGGSFARLLKGTLLAHPKVSRDVFLDSDNLSQLHGLFQTVAYNVDTLLVLGTKDVFMRPWCAGEMTIARLKRINVVVLAMPEWEAPNHKAIYDFEELVDMKPLTENHLTLEMLKGTLRWISTLPVITFPRRFNANTVNVLADKLVSGEMTGEVIFQPDSTPNTRKVQVLVDDVDMEAVAAAHFLVKLLLPHVMHSPEHIPAVLTASEEPPKDFHTLIVVCTNGCLEQRGFLEVLVQAWSNSAKILPVLVDVNFRFPSPEFLASIRGRPSPIASTTGMFLADIIGDIFHEIAIVFQPQQAADYILHANAERIGKRILSDGTSELKKKVSGLDRVAVLMDGLKRSVVSATSIRGLNTRSVSATSSRGLSTVSVSATSSFASAHVYGIGEDSHDDEEKCEPQLSVVGMKRRPTSDSLPSNQIPTFTLSV